jgi:soluble lytic murein transglycosylase
MKRWWPYVVAVLLLVDVIAVYQWWCDRRERSQDVPIRAAAGRYGVEPALIKAVVWRESRFNPRAVGSAKEVGLMQIRLAAAQEWAVAEHVTQFQPEHLFDPRTNTLVGAWYLRKLLKRYAQTDNAAVYALADYNAGRKNVLRWNQGPAASSSYAFLKKIDFPGTQQYINAVLHRRQRYRMVIHL